MLFGLIPTAMALVLYLNGLMQVRAQNASIIALPEPASAVVFAYLILSELHSERGENFPDAAQ